MVWKTYNSFTFTAVVSSLITRMFNLPAFDVYIYYLAIVFAVFSLFSYIHYFYGKGYLPQKEELKETLKVKEKKKKARRTNRFKWKMEDKKWTKQ